MERILEVAGGELAVPVWTDPQGEERYSLDIRDDAGELVYTFKLPEQPKSKAGAEPDYFARLPLRFADGREVSGGLHISCDAPYPVAELIKIEEAAAVYKDEDASLVYKFRVNILYGFNVLR